MTLAYMLPLANHLQATKRLPADANFRYRDHDRAVSRDAQRRPGFLQAGCLDRQPCAKDLIVVIAPHPAFLSLNFESVRNGGSTDDFANRASSAEKGVGINFSCRFAIGYSPFMETVSIRP